MANSNRPNYFQLLDLDPDLPWDPAAFDKRLRAKRGEWSRIVGIGVKTNPDVINALWALEHYDNIRLAMTGPVPREAEAQDARERIVGERARQRAEFDRDLKIMLNKGFLWDTELAELRRKYPVITREDAVAARLEGLPQRIVGEQYTLPPQLDSSRAKGIRELLDVLGEKSLYTLLATLDPRIGALSALDTLVGAANALYDQAKRDINKNDPRLVARQDLAGYALRIFGSPDERSRYDNTLALAPVTDLIAKYQSALDAVKRFEPGQVDGFLGEATATGAAREVALAMLLAHFGALRWVVPLPAETGRADQVRCGDCESWNDADNQFCVVCAARLRITCPSCQRTVVGQGACGNCGFSVGDYDWAVLLVRQAEELVAQRDLAGAQEKIANATRAWPSKGDDELAVQIRQCAAQVSELREQQTAEGETIARGLRTLCDQGNYRAALNKASSVPATVPARDHVIQEATEHIREADRLCELARQPGTSPAQRVEYYTQALTSCADHNPARTALGTLPPEPPHALRAESVDELVRLSWTPSSAVGARYVIVRKPGNRPPVSVGDGARIATVHRTSYDDRSAEPGLPLHYAVFAQRPTGPSSEHGAATEEPVFLTAEVTVTAQRVGDGTVELEWQLPGYATGALAQRTAPGETVDMAVADSARLLDSGLTNGIPHTYTLRASFPGPDGATRLSDGVSVTLTPGPAPAPPGPVHVRTVEPNLGLCYRLVDLLPQGASGPVSLLWTQRRPPVRPGEQLPVTDLARYGSLLTETAARSFALPRAGLYYFAQVVQEHGIGYLGELRRYAACEEITELSGRHLDDVIRLTWQWPDGCTAALVTHHNGAAVADPASAPHQVPVDRVGKDRTGWYDVAGLPSGSGQVLSFVVAAVQRRGDEVFVSTGTHCTVTPPPRRPRRGLRRKN